MLTYQNVNSTKVEKPFIRLLGEKQQQQKNNILLY